MLTTTDSALSSDQSDSIPSTTKSGTNAQTKGGVVIIGAGMAGSRLAIKLATIYKKNGYSAPEYQITLISKEKQVGYNRIMLSTVLAGETEFEDTYLYTKADYETLGIRILAGVGVDSIDTELKIVSMDDGKQLTYHKLVLATGSTARVIPFPGHDAPQVHVFRDVADVKQLVKYANQGKTGLVIGGGVLGLEAACALKAQGANMKVIHVDGYILNRQLDLPAATLLQDELSRRDVGLEVNALSEKIVLDAEGNVAGIAFKNGQFIAADFIVMAVGIIPNTQLAKDSGLVVNRGIVVGKHMHTSCPDVFAIGECVEIDEELFGMVSSVNQHVDSLVSVLTQSPSSGHWQPFESVPLSLKLKVSGIAVFSAGQIEFTEEELAEVEVITYRQHGFNLNAIDGLHSGAGEHYQCLYIKDDKLIGAVLYGETNEGGFYSQLINEKINISAIKDDLIYGESYCTLPSPSDDKSLENSGVNSTLSTNMSPIAVEIKETNHTALKDKATLDSIQQPA